MRLPEVHVWRNVVGRIVRCEFRDGDERMEMRVSRVVVIDEAHDLPHVEFSLYAKPIYHDEEPE